MECQKRLFDLIKSILPPHAKLANEVSKLLAININAVYDRIGNRVPLKLEEVGILCHHYRISMDDAIGLDRDFIPFNYIPLAADDPQQYLRYMQGLKSSMERLAASDNSELIFAADDIPMFHFMPYPELTYFKLYTWSQSMDSTGDSYEQFMRSADRQELRHIFRGINTAYRRVPTSEIWTEETIHPILNLLAHYRDFDKFDHQDTFTKLCGQLMNLLECLEKWTADSCKDGEPAVPYSMYLSPVMAGNSFMLTRCDDEQSVRIKLYTINSIAASDGKLVDETRKWMTQTISKSTSISGTSEITRERFFNGMKAKVSALVP